jgi:hypothetical protein
MARRPVNLTTAERAVVRGWTMRIYGVVAAIVVGVLIAPLLFGGHAGGRRATQGAPTIESRLLK